MLWVVLWCGLVTCGVLICCFACVLLDWLGFDLLIALLFGVFVYWLLVVCFAYYLFGGLCLAV